MDMVTFQMMEKLHLSKIIDNPIQYFSIQLKIHKY